MATVKAADLPVGSEVRTPLTEWVKDNPGDVRPWTDSDGRRWSDEGVDRMLSGGAVVVRVGNGS